MLVSKLDDDVILSRHGRVIGYSAGSILVVNALDLSLRGSLDSEGKTTLKGRA